MSTRGRPERWGVSAMQVGDSLTCSPKQLVYLKQRFRKYGYKMEYQTVERPHPFLNASIQATRVE